MVLNTLLGTCGFVPQFGKSYSYYLLNHPTIRKLRKQIVIEKNHIKFTSEIIVKVSSNQVVSVKERSILSGTTEVQVS